MADRKISDLTALTTPASGDYLPIVDISEAAAASKNKRITVEELMRGAPNGTAAAPSIAFESDPNTGIYSPGADQLAVSTGGTGRLFIDSSGRVGIGTSVPGKPLDVRGTGSVNVGSFSNGNQGIDIATTASGGSIQTFDQNQTLDLKTFGTTTNSINFSVGNTERLRIDSSGRLLVGTSSTLITSTAVLQGSNGATTSEAILRLCRGQDSPADGALLGDLSFGDSNNGDAARIFAQRDGGTWTSASSRPSRLVFSTAADGSATPTERLRIDSSGNVGIGTTAPTTLLDVNADTVRVRTARTPASATATGATGEICWDANYIYVCTATNTWKRTALSTW